MGVVWRTALSGATGSAPAPTRSVGEPSTFHSGCSASAAAIPRASASYVASSRGLLPSA